MIIMKKHLFLILTFLIMNVLNVFSYTVLEDFNDFLIDENQLDIGLDRFGVLAGSENFRFMIGVEGETAGVLLDNLDAGIKGGINKFRPAATIGFGYKNDSFGFGLGYQFRYVSGNWQAHTPIITATALNEDFRINIPLTIGVGSGDSDGDVAFSTDTRIEYFTGNEIFSRIRINLQYGLYKLKANDRRSDDAGEFAKNSMQVKDGIFGFTKDTIGQSIGIDLRAYFVAATDPILIEPQIRILYQGSIRDFKGTSYSVRGGGSTRNGAAEFGLYNIDASNPIGAFELSDATDTHPSYLASASLPEYYDFVAHNIAFTADGASIEIGENEYYITKPQFVGISMPVGFTAESDLITLYLEPAISFSMITGGVNVYASSSKPVRIPPVFYSLGYLLYGELSITPLPNLELYFETQIGSATTVDNIGNSTQGGLAFNGSTRIIYRF